MLPKLRKSLLMNRLEHGTNPNYKYIASEIRNKYQQAKMKINLVIFDFYLQ